MQRKKVMKSALLALAVLLGLASSPAIAGPSNAAEKMAKLFGAVPACIKAGVIKNTHDDDLYIADATGALIAPIDFLKQQKELTEEQLQKATVALMEKLGYEEFCRQGKPLMDEVVNDMRKNAPDLIRLWRQAAGVQ
jgi:hypothetical protein